MDQPQETGSLESALRSGEIELKGQFMLGSNYTFLVDVRYEDQTFPAVYKPSKGEQPLWDFPDTSLSNREVAAYLVSQALGWRFVPLTLFRDDGPFGPGSLQRYVEYDPNYHYFTFTKEDKDLLRPVALFDLLCNNADRKGSHIIFEKNDVRSLWLIDHGLCFHEEDKLRTILWDFAGQEIPGEYLDDIEHFIVNSNGTSNLQSDLSPYLASNEITALITRARTLITSGTFPLPPADRRVYPYPPL
jgi:uncharacterized repeat protein (TIGR03843 family)